MKTLTILFCLLFSVSLALPAQTTEEQSNTLMEALKQGRKETVLPLFRKLLKQAPEQAETCFRLYTEEGTSLHMLLAEELIDFYRTRHDYDKAYTLCRELLDLRPQDVSLIAACADLQFQAGHLPEAVALYERVLTKDSAHVQAHIFLGNYHYWQGERARKVLDEEYSKLPSPTRMQYANYRNNLSLLLTTYYAHAKQHLQSVLHTFSSTEAAKTLQAIEELEEKFGE